MWLCSNWRCRPLSVLRLSHTLLSTAGLIIGLDWLEKMIEAKREGCRKAGAVERSEVEWSGVEKGEVGKAGRTPFAYLGGFVFSPFARRERRKQGVMCRCRQGRAEILFSRAD